MVQDVECFHYFFLFIGQDLECGHQPFIEALQQQLLELQADNTALLMENSDLKDRVNSLVTELSIKEATWCENEEKLKIEVRTAHMSNFFQISLIIHKKQINCLKDFS